jgi:4-hydroxy-3-methylbut-2-enyl diphosphate reductase
MRGQVDVVIVVGSATSSNSNRLRELAQRMGADSHMIDTAAELQAQWFEGKPRVGLTAGASAPEEFLDRFVGDFLHESFRVGI